jgi:hypothetical protein
MQVEHSDDYELEFDEADNDEIAVGLSQVSVTSSPHPHPQQRGGRYGGVTSAASSAARTSSALPAKAAAG